MAKAKRSSNSGSAKGKRYPERAKDVLVTQAMLYAVRDELIERDKSIHGEIATLRAETTGGMHRLMLLMEEQNARNNVVLDGLTVLFSRQERIEGRVTDIEKVLLGAK